MTITQAGYGQKQIGSKVQYAHRIAWQLNEGPIPKGLCVLHRCDNRRCVRPSHLFLGTKKDNAIDAISKGRAPQLSKKQTCLKGHIFSKQNTYWYPMTGKKAGERECRICRTRRFKNWSKNK